MTESTALQLSSESAQRLKGIERGIEKEGLRVTPEGFIAQTQHPKALGSTLTHPSITTDYSEALLEFITPKHGSVIQSLNQLAELHTFALERMGDEHIWPASMPCRIQGEASIPIADYGSSNVGLMKHVYRRGLEVRYGRIMQAIAGIHYNVSFPHAFWQSYQRELGDTNSLDHFRSAHYFHLIRNFHRHSWLLYYLFGASPVLDHSFFDGHQPTLTQYGDTTWGLPHATSLRMSDLGYTNSAQQGLYIGYDSLDDYVRTLSHAVHQPYAAYEQLGVKDANGDYQQLNANILQIENEYYSEIRPKRVARSGERPVQALQRGGVEYIEVRALDINPFLPVGIDAQTCRFIDAFALYCLLSHSAQQCPNEWAEIAQNRDLIIKQGRDPSLTLSYCGRSMTVQEWVKEILSGVAQAANLLDSAYGNYQTSEAVEAQMRKGENPELTPSGQMMQCIHAGQEFVDLVQTLAREHADTLKALPMNEARTTTLEQTATSSLEEQTQREQSDDLSFEDYLNQYNQL